MRACAQSAVFQDNLAPSRVPVVGWRLVGGLDGALLLLSYLGVAGPPRHEGSTVSTGLQARLATELAVAEREKSSTRTESVAR